MDLKLNNIKHNSKKNFKFIFLLNIKRFRLIDEDDSDYKNERKIYENVLKIFDIERVVIEKFTIDGAYEDQSNLNKLMQIFKNSHGETIEISINARDFEFAEKLANSKLDLFLGFFSFMRYRFLKRIDFNDDKPIDKINAKSCIVLEGDKLIYPYLKYVPERTLDSIRNEVNEVRFTNSIDLKIRYNLSYFEHYIELMKETKNDKSKKKLWKCLTEFLRLYYDACTEKNLPYAFLKFWMIGETIIKKISGKIKDENLLKRLEQVFKVFHNDKFIRNRFKFLYLRRNELVHEGNFEQITYVDRNLAKIIADSVLLFYISYMNDLNNLAEYDFLIQNMNKSDNEIDRYSLVLKIISKNR
ncbi:hypothetical protein Metbo_1133 [Methanobacterium lacus]|uniref:Uncharacterized protein n=1 Tax=Methanobacterium lacus (strain AL-21) TaxID=877455 RepID=F0T5Y4_METLA|nr:HEPN domain-containing protein [Methanobacterium lacus]ADZ09377.1 hypothetical protein Metbo_1133 [Methanobacterium lacus]